MIILTLPVTQWCRTFGPTPLRPLPMGRGWPGPSRNIRSKSLKTFCWSCAAASSDALSFADILLATHPVPAPLSFADILQKSEALSRPCSPCEMPWMNHNPMKRISSAEYGEHLLWTTCQIDNQPWHLVMILSIFSDICSLNDAFYNDTSSYMLRWEPTWTALRSAWAIPNF